MLVRHDVGATHPGRGRPGRAGEGRLPAWRPPEGRPSTSATSRSRYSAAGDSVRLAAWARTGERIAVRMSRSAWDDLVAQMSTFVGLLLRDELQIRARWVRAVGRAGSRSCGICTPGSLPMTPPGPISTDSDPNRLVRRRTPGTTELASQLRTMGVLHVTGVFNLEEMAAANQGDRPPGGPRPPGCRPVVVGDRRERHTRRLPTRLHHGSVLLSCRRSRAIPRVRRLGTLLDPELRIAPDRMEGPPC